jgi:hypothetical protein
MRFVTPEVVRIDLKDGPNGEKNWIEVKKELTVGEEKRFRSAGLTGMKPGAVSEISVDWGALAIGRLLAYLTDWSATKLVKGKPVAVPVTRDAIEALDQADFDEIDDAIQAHIKRQADEKKVTSGANTAP